MPPQGEPGIPRPSQVSHIYSSSSFNVNGRVTSQHLARDGGHETPMHHPIRHRRSEEARHRRREQWRCKHRLHRRLYREWRSGVRRSEALARTRGAWLTQRWCWKPLYASAEGNSGSHSSHSSKEAATGLEHRGRVREEERKRLRAETGALTRLSESAGVEEEDVVPLDLTQIMHSRNKAATFVGGCAPPTPPCEL